MLSVSALAWASPSPIRLPLGGGPLDEAIDLLRVGGPRPEAAAEALAGRDDDHRDLLALGEARPLLQFDGLAADDTSQPVHLILLRDARVQGSGSVDSTSTRATL